MTAGRAGAPQRTGPVLLSGVPPPSAVNVSVHSRASPRCGPVVDDGGEPGVAHGEVRRTQVHATVPQGAGSHAATRHATAVEDRRLDAGCPELAGAGDA